MWRREFIRLFTSTAVAWPLAARAQQPDHMRRLGLLMALPENDAEEQRRVAAFVQTLLSLGWKEGANIRIDYRWPGADADRIHRAAVDLLDMKPDAILAETASTVAALQRLTSTVPIVFVQFVDPVGSGAVASLSRPGGNITGFTPKEFSGAGASNADELKDAINSFSAKSNGGIVVLGHPLIVANRDLIITLLARYRLPAVYDVPFFVREGGLVSYGLDPVVQYRQAASYVDRILKGEKPADLPVQAPIKYELVINLKTAKALGLDVPPTTLARADEVIE